MVVVDSCLMFFPTERGVSRLARNPIHAVVWLHFFCHDFLCKYTYSRLWFYYVLQEQGSYWAACLSHCTRSNLPNTSKRWPVPKLFTCLTIHPLPAVTSRILIGGPSGYSTLPKGLPQASGGKEAPYCSYWWNYYHPATHDVMINKYSIRVKNKFSALGQLATAEERWQMFKESMLE